MDHECKHPLKCSVANQCLKDYVEAAPQSWEDLCTRQAWNTEITGSFLDTTIHLPCPACGAKDFMVYKIMESEEVNNAGAVCKECERGFRIPVRRPDANTISVGLVQTVGPDLPDWFKIEVPRVQAN